MFLEAIYFWFLLRSAFVVEASAKVHLCKSFGILSFSQCRTLVGNAIRIAVYQFEKGNNSYCVYAAIRTTGDTQSGLINRRCTEGSIYDRSRIFLFKQSKKRKKEDVKKERERESIWILQWNETFLHANYLRYSHPYFLVDGWAIKVLLTICWTWYKIEQHLFGNVLLASKVLVNNHHRSRNESFLVQSRNDVSFDCRPWWCADFKHQVVVVRAHVVIEWRI